MQRNQALIIDDNPLNVEILATLLDSSGIDSRQLSSPRQLDSVWAELGSLKVIFLDLEIPNYDGFEIHQALRANAALQDIPIIAYTVHTSEIDLVRKAGFDGFLGKPLDPSTFPKQLARILSGKPVWEVG